ncbi:ABC transporter ATP-binding protein [Streptococcus pantholopis]|uniref:ABC transporter ATP-binding protein n=1 Tax=Streptococcus pantholopis TaxID=1811193 RepID=UPI00214FD173|nr:ABC transporter ATP-binding protein [Streptococcus pantholopis]
MYLFQLADPFSQVISFFANYQKFRASVHKIQELLLEPTEEDALPNGKVASFSRNTGLYLHNITFSYNTEETLLKDINYEFQSCRTTAIIGTSGAGKTTLFSLIERFYYPAKGTIFFQNRDISSIPLKNWRKQIAYLSQDVEISYGSLLENLTYGVDQYSMVDINELVEQFDLRGFVDSLENGYNTIIGEKGVAISGGQKQRIALIRAILRNADIYLLDEPTSALDNHTEKLVQLVLDKYLKGKTVLVIAHRLKTIISADEIIILNNKKIEYRGTHNELINSCALYKKLLEDSIYR